MVEIETIVILCSKCNLYQATLTVLFGRKIKNKKCVRCGNMIPLEGGIKLKDELVPEYVRKLNYPHELPNLDELLEFK